MGVLHGQQSAAFQFIQSLHVQPMVLLQLRRMGLTEESIGARIRDQTGISSRESEAFSGEVWRCPTTDPMWFFPAEMGCSLVFQVRFLLLHGRTRLRLRRALRAYRVFLELPMDRQDRLGQRVLWVLQVRQGLRVIWDRRDLREQVVCRDLQDLQVLRDSADQRDLREQVVCLDLRDHRVMLDHLERWVRRVILDRRVRQDLSDLLEYLDLRGQRDRTVLLDRRDHLDPQVCVAFRDRRAILADRRDRLDLREV